MAIKKTAAIILAILCMAMTGCESVKAEEYRKMETPDSTDFDSYDWVDSEHNCGLEVDMEGSYIWYNDLSNVTDDFYEGSYTMYYQEEAEQELTNTYAEYGISKETLDQLYAKNDNYGTKSICLLVTDCEMYVLNGKMSPDGEVGRVYLGFFNGKNGEKLFLTDLSTEAHYNFEREAKGTVAP